jgi:hypothetical protein
MKFKSIGRTISFVVGMLAAISSFSQACVDSTLIDPYALCIALWEPVCGCNGVTYSNDCEATVSGGLTAWVEGECSGNAQDCFDLGGVDFGLCDMVMGVALINGSCQFLSGCGWIIDDVDYSPYSFDSEDECSYLCGSSECIDPTLDDPTIDCDIFNPLPVCGCDSITHFNNCLATHVSWVTSYQEGACLGDCFDPLRIVPDIGCIEILAPVCGCNDITYDNACLAWYSGGLAQWTEGPCETNGSPQNESALKFQITPNPNEGEFLISGFQPATSWQLFNSAGIMILAGQGNRIKENLPSGLFILRSEGFLPARFIVN